MRTAACLLAVVFAFTGPAAWLDAQSAGPRPPFDDAAQDPQFGPRRNEDPRELEREREREKQRNEKRHSSLREDTEKLLQLAAELKDAVDETTENKLSLDVIRKAEQIEKLAKQVRNKMRGS